MNALKRIDWLARRGVKIINQACKIAFSIGFERCKIMAQVHLPADSTELLQANFSNESLKVVTKDSTRRFAKIYHGIVEINKVDTATQTEGDVGTEEDHSEASHPYGVPRE